MLLLFSAYSITRFTKPCYVPYEPCNTLLYVKHIVQMFYFFRSGYIELFRKTYLPWYKQLCLCFKLYWDMYFKALCYWLYDHQHNKCLPVSLLSEIKFTFTYSSLFVWWWIRSPTKFKWKWIHDILGKKWNKNKNTINWCYKCAHPVTRSLFT